VAQQIQGIGFHSQHGLKEKKKLGCSAYIPYKNFQKLFSMFEEALKINIHIIFKGPTVRKAYFISSKINFGWVPVAHACNPLRKQKLGGLWFKASLGK
jgi:hypothetical protein